MKRFLWLLILGVAVGGCSTRNGGGFPVPGSPDGDVVIVGDEDRSREGGIHARSLDIPPGHYPPPGECRIWYSRRPAGQQPPPARCGSLLGHTPLGAFLLYNDRAWDTEYDWRREEARRPGSVPEIVLRIMGSLVRE